MGMTGTHVGEVVFSQISNTPAKFSGSSISDWGVALVNKAGGWSGLYAYDNPTTTGGGQDLIYASDHSLVHISHNRNTSPFVYLRTSTDDDFFGSQVSDVDSLAFNGTAGLWRNDNTLLLMGNWWNGGNTGSLRYNLYNRNLQLTETGNLNIAGNNAPQSRPIVLASGTILVPLHFASGATTAVGVLRSTDGGITWARFGNTTAAYSLAEPSIIVNTAGNILMASRAEDNIIALNYYSSIGSNDGQTWDATAIAWTEVPMPTRVGGNPSVLYRLANGTYVHIYAPGNGENYWTVSTSIDGIDWNVLANIDAVEPGTNDAFRYLDVIERRENGSIMIVAGEEDIPINACQQCVIFISSVNVAQFTNGSYICPISPKSCDPLYIDLYFIAPIIGNGDNVTIRLGNVTNNLAGWDLAGAGANPNSDMFTLSGSGLISANNTVFANKEKRLRWIYHPSTNLVDFYINDRAIRTNDSPVAGWSGLPDRITLNIADSGTYQIRKQKVWTN